MWFDGLVHKLQQGSHLGGQGGKSPPLISKNSDFCVFAYKI